jgi:hypothetical protein
MVLSVVHRHAGAVGMTSIEVVVRTHGTAAGHIPPAELEVPVVERIVPAVAGTISAGVAEAGPDRVVGRCSAAAGSTAVEDAGRTDGLQETSPAAGEWAAVAQGGLEGGSMHCGPSIPSHNQFY